MIGIRGRVSALLKHTVIGKSRSNRVFECQQCGLSLADSADQCPECGAETIVHYSFG